MMHGYLPFDDNDDLLVPFRTWRNNNANKAAEILREDFQVNIPERWVSHNFINLHWIKKHMLRSTLYDDTCRIHTLVSN